MKFCPTCSEALEDKIPAGDNRLRKVCPACAAVHYRNPLPVVGCLVERGDQVLMCTRAIEPGHGLWTLPAGFLEVGESARDGARRETLEEACADVEIVSPFVQLDLPHLGQTYSIFRARMRTPEFGVGEESLDVGFVERSEIPWAQIAFPVIAFALRFYVADREAASDALHLGALRYGGQGSRFDEENYEVQDYARHPLEG